MENPQPSPMVGADRLARQVLRYGQVISNELTLDPAYNQEACDECAYEHSCCNLLVTVTPYEALGIISWVKTNLPDGEISLKLVGMRAEVIRQFIADKEGKPHYKNPVEMFTAWWKRGMKCVFYDSKAREGSGGCSIYPVRPVNCRKAFGKGDCSDDTASGIDSMAEDPHLFETRANRAQVRQLLASGQKTAELHTMIKMLRTPGALITSEDPKIMQSEPELLTDEQVLFGLGAQPIENQWTEEVNHGNSRSAG